MDFYIKKYKKFKYMYMYQVDANVLQKKLSNKVHVSLFKH